MKLKFGTVAALTVGLGSVHLGMAFAEGSLPGVRMGMRSGADNLALEATRDVFDSVMAARRRAASLTDGARSKHDMLLLTCVLDKARQIDALADRALERFNAIESSKEDMGLINVHSVVISVVSEKAQTLLREAAECRGKDVRDFDLRDAKIVVPQHSVDPSATGNTSGSTNLLPPDVLSHDTPHAGNPSTTTDYDPSKDMPDMPSSASPVR